MKALIINIDDVGFSTGINNAARECYTAGVITGVSVVACGEKFTEAASMLHSIGKNEAGVHLTLTGDFTPCTKNPLDVKTLVEEGVFPKNYLGFSRRYAKKKINPNEIYLELVNQVKRVKGSGLEITHLDSHEHIHMFPEVLNAVVRLAKEFNVPYVRLPLECSCVAKKKFSIKDFMRHLALQAFALKGERHLNAAHVRHNDFFMGHFHSGRIDDEVLTFMLENLHEGTTELAVHASTPSKEIDESSWYKNSPRELDALLNGKWKDLILSRGINLLTHRESSERLV